MSTTKTMTKYALWAAVVAVIFAIGMTFVLGLRSPVPAVAFARSAVVTSSNANFVSIGITNQSNCTIVYLACPPQVKSNGSWGNVQIPPVGKPMATLAAGQSGLLVIEAALLSEESRVPVLWGFMHQVTTYRWLEFVFDRIIPSDPAGRGRLCTNYAVGIRLEEPGRTIR